MCRRIRRERDLEDLAPLQLDKWTVEGILDRLRGGTGIRILADDYVLTSGDELADLPHGRARLLEIHCEKPWVVLRIGEGRVELFGDDDDQAAVDRIERVARYLQSKRRHVPALINSYAWLWYLLNSLVGLIPVLFRVVPNRHHQSLGFQAAVIVLAALSVLGIVGLLVREWINNHTMALMLGEQTFMRRNRDNILVGTILSIVGSLVAVAFSMVAG